MPSSNREIASTSNLYKTKALRTIYFENSLIGRGLGLLGMKYLSSSQKVETLSSIREANKGRGL